VDPNEKKSKTSFPETGTRTSPPDEEEEEDFLDGSLSTSFGVK
tara:strand:+ start:1127 stop:1255 length:129 start_codon:yes stop_codon:yes gene_type:complete